MLPGRVKTTRKIEGGRLKLSRRKLRDSTRMAAIAVVNGENEGFRLRVGHSVQLAVWEL